MALPTMRTRNGRIALNPYHLVWMFWIASAAFAADPADAAEKLLNTMRSAMAELTYRGIVAYSKNNEVENMEVLHSVVDGVEHEKLITLNGPMREVVRQGQAVKCYFPDSKMVFSGSKPSGKSAFVSLPEDFLKLRVNYEFSLGRRDRIAQRDAQEVRIQPRDDLRYGRRIWIDLASKLALKVELLDERNNVVEQMVFSSLDLDAPIAAKDLDLSPDQSLLQWETSEHVPLPIESLRWRLQNVPAGFQIVAFSRVKQPADRRSIEHLLLSDGLSSISVYFDRVGEKLVVGQPRNTGAIHSFSRKIGEYAVTSMGEVPQKAVEYLANGIRFQDQD